MKKLITISAMALLTACQSGEADARSDRGVVGAGTELKGTSTARWEGKSAGQLRFDDAACMVMNGEIINFYAPARARDNIGQETMLPQINGTKGGNGWTLNIVANDGAIHSGSGTAGAETPRTLDLIGTLLDGQNANRGGVDTVSATIRIECTEIDDLGTMP